MIETDKFSDLICKHKITPNQVYILWLLYTKDYTNIQKYIDAHGQFDTDDFIVLEDKNLILNTNPKGRYSTANICVTIEFVEERADKDPEDLWDEFFDVYPGHLIVNNNKIPAKTLKFEEEKGVKAAYIKAISKNKFMHQKILTATNKWKEANSGYATIKIDKFVIGKYWEEIDKQEDDGKVKPSYY